MADVKGHAWKRHKGIILGPQFVFLFCFGLCVEQTDLSGNEPLPKLSLSAWPSSVVPPRSNITLRCTSPFLVTKLVLRKGETILKSRMAFNSTEKTTEFHLTKLQQSDAGPYTCEDYKEDSDLSQPSDVLLLLVTGHLPKPSLRTHQWSNVTAGDNVILQCERPENFTEYKMFALLKEGASSPIHFQSSENNRVDFSLRDVSVNDKGSYSCIYYQMAAPYWTSDPSDPLEILVTDSLLKPILSAWPSSVAFERSNVTLRCTSPTPGIYLVLRKEDTILASKLPHHLTEGTAEFHLTELRQSDAGTYKCEYYRKGFPDILSPSSDALLLLVTGYASKPSLQAHPRSRVTTGEKIILQCQKPGNMTEYKTFALLKAGASSPIQLQHSENDKVDFTLSNVTVSNTGRYSCVYHQTKAPFRASHPSDHLAILVTVSSSITSEYYTRANLIRLGVAVMFMVILAVFLIEAWYSRGQSPWRSRPRSTL